MTVITIVFLGCIDILTLNIPTIQEISIFTGPVEAGVRGVPRHTQYLPVYLVMT